MDVFLLQRHSIVLELLFYLPLPLILRFLLRPNPGEGAN